VARRKVCVVSGTRAEYGLLFWLLRAIQEDPALDLQLVLTGAHLSKEFGYTKSVVEKDGFAIADEVDILLSSGSELAVTKSIGLGVIGFSESFRRLAPDLLVVLGDRYEILAAATAAMVARIPIAHIHGGESSEGLIDEAIRHAVTKMAHLHFVSAEDHRRRVIQLGEQPDRVWNVGAPGLDNIRRLKLLSRSALERELGYSLGESYFLVTYHPVTLAKEGPARVLENLFRAAAQFPNTTLLFTKANADADGRVINEIIARAAATDAARIKLVDSLGQRRYLSAMRHAAAVVGNSSSGLIEAPAMGVPTVNIGDRQRGRIRAASVIDCGNSEKEIARALKTALSPAFRKIAQRTVSPYGDGKSSPRIARILRSVDLDGILFKTFHDLPGDR
jgi:UDP-N-acetylglucosamine 2-epimerase (non-hydrolysing)/GDP/UDP-N,N'-diacetylbacillosamine 2-epimerase (hydrolysing)